MLNSLNLQVNEQKQQCFNIRSTILQYLRLRRRRLYQSNGDTLRSGGQLQDQLLMVETRVTIN